MIEKLIKKSIENAHSNWKEWKDIFQHKGPKSKNPLLVDSKRFRDFRKEYSINRTIAKGKHEDFRKALAKSPQLISAIKDKSGIKLDELEKALRPNFGAQGGKRALFSVLSKIAAFLKPEIFIAWDRFAKKGVKKALAKKGSFENYADYLLAVEKAWKNEPGKEIRSYMKKNGARGIERNPGFLRRVLDGYLMYLGGRKY